MKQQYVAEITRLFDNLLADIDEREPNHELHYDNLAVDMAKAAAMVYDASAKGQLFARQYDSPVGKT